MMIGLSSKTLSLIDISQLARWTIKPRLMGVQGVANVSTFGHRERQLQVQVDPKRLNDKGVALLDVVEADRKRPVGLAAQLPRGVHPRHRRLHRDR